MEELERDFSAFVRQRAEQLAPGLDWQKPKLEDLISKPSEFSVAISNLSAANSESLPKFLRRSNKSTNNTDHSSSDQAEAGSPTWEARHPTNYYAVMERAKTLVSKKDFAAAKAPLKLLVQLYPTQTGAESAYALLAATHRALGETNAERQVLAQFAQQDAEASEAYLRAAELAAEFGEWPGVVDSVHRCLAVNPLVAAPYKLLAQASRHTDNLDQAIQANAALLELDPPNPAEVHFELARALHRKGNPRARRQVLEALEEAPRYQAALRLLLELQTNPPPPHAEAPPPVEASP